jgi:hypothetical protein
MKKLSVCALAILLVVGTTSALASGSDHRRSSNDTHNTHRSHYSYGNHYKTHYRHGYKSHHRSSFYSHSYLGAALIGSALRYGEVVGRHRIERLPNGRHRRVDVARSQCE